MAKHNVSSGAYCPFYRYDDRSVIACEGCIKGSSIHMAFASPAVKKLYLDKVCSTKNYRRCRVAMMLEQKWEDINRETENRKTE